jgi:hypothetical protein
VTGWAYFQITAEPGHENSLDESIHQSQGLKTISELINWEKTA